MYTVRHCEALLEQLAAMVAFQGHGRPSQLKKGPEGRAREVRNERRERKKGDREGETERDVY